MTQSYESFYVGAPDYFNSPRGAEASSDFASTGFSASHFQVNPARMGIPGLPTTPDQLGQAIIAIKNGVKAFEVSVLELGGKEEVMPKQHFEEIGALLKLSGVKPSLHGPLIDPAAVSSRSGRWMKEEERKENEKRMFEAVRRAQSMDPHKESYVPIVFHASNSMGREYAMDEKGKKFLQRSYIVNQETGEIGALEVEKRYEPGTDLSKQTIKDLETKDNEGKTRIEELNKNQWNQQLTSSLSFNNEIKDFLAPISMKRRLGQQEIEQGLLPLKDYNRMEYDSHNKALYKLEETPQGFKRVLVKDPNLKIEGNAEKEEAIRRIEEAKTYVENLDLRFKKSFDEAYRYGNENQKKELEQLSKEYAKRNKEVLSNEILYPLQRQQMLRDQFLELKRITAENAPQVFKEVEDLAMQESSKTFANLAMRSYEEFIKKGKGAPTLVIENLPGNMAFNDAEQLRKLVNESRQKFAEQLTHTGMNKKEAEKLAEKQIGVTWDLGHVNTLKKRGYTDEHVIEETQKIAGTGEHKHNPNLVRHIHIDDNFGFDDTHLPPGMGNAPIAQMLKELQDTGEFDAMNKIIEAGAYVGAFRKSPVPASLQAMASPIYGMKQGNMNNNIGFDQVGPLLGGYFGGYGTSSPSIHHSIYGGGFSGLPTELGGQMPGEGQSRFGGTPMA